jgi:hypothetical protein
MGLETAPPAPLALDTVERVLALGLPLPEARKLIVAEFERRYIERVLEANDGKVGMAAAAAGIAGRYFRLLRARSRHAQIPAIEE